MTIGSNLRLLNERPELWAIPEDGPRRSTLEWCVETTPADRERTIAKANEQLRRKLPPSTLAA